MGDGPQKATTRNENLKGFLAKHKAQYEKYQQRGKYLARACLLVPSEEKPQAYAQMPRIAFLDAQFPQRSSSLTSLNLWDNYAPWKQSSRLPPTLELESWQQKFAAAPPAMHCAMLPWLPKLQRLIAKTYQVVTDYQTAETQLSYLAQRQHWLEAQVAQMHMEIWPLLRTFHWEDDAGGDQDLNQVVSWWELTRTNRKDMLAALIFGIRISLVVGLLSVAVSLIISIPIGALAGFYGGKTDIIVCRILEIWEGMPTFFMLLLIIAVTQSKSIFLVIGAIGFFGWTQFSRYIRAETETSHQSYVEACRAQAFSDAYTIFVHILPNAIPPLLTLLPFAVMGAITSETGLAFLGLGEENSCSLGVLMNEARQVFPGESYLLWPPAIMLTCLLIAIAIVGDALRDALDPKLHRV